VEHEVIENGVVSARMHLLRSRSDDGLADVVSIRPNGHPGGRGGIGGGSFLTWAAGAMAAVIVGSVAYDAQSRLSVSSRSIDEGVGCRGVIADFGSTVLAVLAVRNRCAAIGLPVPDDGS
jgi:hypothetical protein